MIFAKLEFVDLRAVLLLARNVSYMLTHIKVDDVVSERDQDITVEEVYHLVRSTLNYLVFKQFRYAWLICHSIVHSVLPIVSFTKLIHSLGILFHSFDGA